jgi:hypothetical protein
MELIAKSLLEFYLATIVVILALMFYIVIDICRIIKQQSHKTTLLLKSDRELRGRLIIMEETTSKLVKARQRPLETNCLRQ